jgi:hypothetical protein
LILDHPNRRHVVLVEDLAGSTVTLNVEGRHVPEFLNFIRTRTSGSARHMGLAV